MSARFNHIIIITKDSAASADFYREILEAEDAPSWGIFTNLSIEDDALLQFASPPVEPTAVHMAFLCDDDHFGRALEALQRRGVDYWADPQKKRPQQTNTDHGGQGVYFEDPSGNFIELITKPYV